MHLSFLIAIVAASIGIHALALEANPDTNDNVLAREVDAHQWSKRFYAPDDCVKKSNWNFGTYGTTPVVPMVGTKIVPTQGMIDDLISQVNDNIAKRKADWRGALCKTQFVVCVRLGKGVYINAGSNPGNFRTSVNLANGEILYVSQYYQSTIVFRTQKGGNLESYFAHGFSYHYMTGAIKVRFTETINNGESLDYTSGDRCHLPINGDYYITQP